jgi:hypothetical protein
LKGGEEGRDLYPSLDETLRLQRDVYFWYRQLATSIRLDRAILPLLTQNTPQPLNDRLALLGRPDRDPQTALTPDLVPPKPHNDLLLLGHLGVNFLCPHVAHLPSVLERLVEHLDEHKVCVVPSQNAAEARDGREGGEEEGPLSVEESDGFGELGEGRGGEGGEGERGGGGGDAVGGFGVVHDLDEGRGRDG